MLTDWPEAGVSNEEKLNFFRWGTGHGAQGCLERAQCFTLYQSSSRGMQDGAVSGVC